MSLNVQAVDPRKSRLMDLKVKDSGESVELTGQQRATFMDEMKARTLANGTIMFLKGFPGFETYWFETLDEAKRDFAHTKLQMVILDSMCRVSGFGMDKARGIKDEVIRYCDELPAFTQWKTVVLGSTLRERIDHQLTEYLYKELKRL